MSARVLVTGATGFIGRHALAPLRERGFEVHAIARATSSAPNESGDVTWHVADLADAAAIRALLSAVRPSHLLHFAWYVEHGRFWSSPENVRWVGRSLDLVHAFHDCGGRRAVLAGTCAEYAWGPDACDEATTPLEPSTLYGVCKDALRQVTDAFGRSVGLSTAWGRVFFLYGPHEAESRLVPSVVTALLRESPALCTSGEQVRDLLHVADVAEAFAALLDSDVTGAVNIASGAGVALKDVVRAIGERMGRPDLVRLGARSAPAGDPPRIDANVTRLRTEVGWSPSRTLAEGLDETVRWWRDALGDPAAVGRAPGQTAR